MDEHEALAVLGLPALPSEWVELQRAFEDKARLARSRVQFPSAGMSRDAALDELDQVKAAWVVLQNRTPPPAPRSPGRGMPRSLPPLHAPVSPSSGGSNRLRIFWDTLRVFLPKISALVWQAGLVLWLFITRSWRTTRVIARLVATLFKAYIRLVCRMTGARPAAVGIATVGVLLVIPILLWSARLQLSSTIENPVAFPSPQIVAKAVEGALGHGVSSEASSSNAVPPPVTPAGGCIVKVFTWPPAKVYCNGEFLTEAPSPQRFRLRGGEQRILLVSTRGERRLIRLTTQPDREYELKYDFDTNELNVEEYAR